MSPHHIAVKISESCGRPRTKSLEMMAEHLGWRPSLLVTRAALLITTSNKKLLVNVSSGATVDGFLCHQDLVVRAETGGGKTLSFLLPTMDHLSADTVVSLMKRHLFKLRPLGGLLSMLCFVVALAVSG